MLQIYDIFEFVSLPLDTCCLYTIVRRFSINIFQKALQNTRDTWFGKAMSLFDRASIGKEVWEELEELLIAADVGVSTAEKLIAAVKERAAVEKLDGSHVRTLLKEEMVKILSVPSGTPAAAITPRRLCSSSALTAAAKPPPSPN